VHDGVDEFWWATISSGVGWQSSHCGAVCVSVQLLLLVVGVVEVWWLLLVVWVIRELSALCKEHAACIVGG
jgi:hypothetical protein